MPDNPDIPHDVQEFLRHHISSAAQLEILLFLTGQPEKQWYTAATISDELRSEQTLVTELLVNLHTAGLLAIQSRASDRTTCYRFAPRNALLRSQVAALATLYRQRRYTVLAFLYEHPSPPL